METNGAPASENGKVLPGTLEMLILKTLARNGEANGAEIARSIHRASDGNLNVKEGALYPALHRLQRRGAVESHPGLSRNNRRALLYRVTTEGMKELEAQQKRWGRLTSAVGKVMEQP